MRKRILPSLFILLCVTILACLSCASVMDRVTPAYTPPQAPEYVNQEVKDLYSLFELRIMQSDIAIHHRNMQLELLRAAEDDELAFQDAKGFIEPAIAEANSFQQKVIGNDANPISISGFLFALTGGVIGRSFFRRPGDLTTDEARAKGAEV